MKPIVWGHRLWAFDILEDKKLLLQSLKWELIGSYSLRSFGCVLGHFVQLCGTSLRTDI